MEQDDRIKLSAPSIRRRGRPELADERIVVEIDRACLVQSIGMGQALKNSQIKRHEYCDDVNLALYKGKSIAAESVF